MNKTQFWTRRLTLLIITVMLSACQPSVILAATATSPVIAGDLGTATPHPFPTQYLEFSSLSEIQKKAKFPIWLPQFIPDSLPFQKAWISDYVNNVENIRILYAEPNNVLNANLKAVDIQLTQTDEPISRESVKHQLKVIPLDVLEVQVYGQLGLSYWAHSNAAGNSAVLTWRKNGINFQISLSGDWPEPNENSPHSLDNTLLKIAESFQVTQ